MSAIRRLLLLFALALPASAAARSAPSYESSVAPDGSLRLYAPGVLRSDEGTIELTVRFSKPTSEFGNAWEFLVSTQCAKNLGPGGYTMLGAFIPPAPERGLTFLIRTARGSTYLNSPTFTCRNGEVMNLAFSWGRELRFYVNGVLKGRTSWRGPLDADLFSPFLTVERLGPYNTAQLRISTRERAATELNPDPSLPFLPDDDTVFIADQGLTRFEQRTTRWHTASACGRCAMLASAVSMLILVCGRLSGREPAFAIPGSDANRASPWPCR